MVRPGEMPKGLPDLPRVQDTSPSTPLPGHKAGAERFGVHSGRRAAPRYGTHQHRAQVRSSVQPLRSQEGPNCHGVAEALKRPVLEPPRPKHALGWGWEDYTRAQDRLLETTERNSFKKPQGCGLRVGILTSVTTKDSMMTVYRLHTGWWLKSS